MISVLVAIAHGVETLCTFYVAWVIWRKLLPRLRATNEKPRSKPELPYDRWRDSGVGFEK